MALDEIEKIRVKVEKDPNSRLFLPLAEEYRKLGMLDEAIAALLNGLKRMPGYTSARVALGRLYLEKSMLSEAKTEFENVVRVIPDNLFAHKKLADIYKALGETKKAAAEYMLVVRLNPLDDEARTCLEGIEGKGMRESKAVPPEPSAPPPPDAEAVRKFEGAPIEETLGEFSIDEEVEEKPDEGTKEPIGSDFEEFKSFFSQRYSSNEAEHAGKGIEEDALKKEGVPEISETPKEAVFDEFYERMVSQEEVETGAGVIGLSIADSLVAGGDYSAAVEAYKELLSREPENKHILQRIAELKSLLKLIGKGDDIVIAKLESFLDAIRQRGREKTEELSGGI